MAYRNVVLTVEGNDTTDGAGVRLRRMFAGEAAARLFDPFLLLDAFGSLDPGEYLAGFPMHPHRGIETVTYMLEGSVRHRDSLGNGGTIGPGDVQWMSAASGILHEEMPIESPRGVAGLQLWVNLAARDKMGPPRYREVAAASIPELRMTWGRVRVLAGSFENVTGPVTGVAGAPVFLDFSLEVDAAVDVPIPEGRNAFCHVLEGAIRVDSPGAENGIRSPVSGAAADRNVVYDSGTCLLLGPGEEARFVAAGGEARFICVHAPPLGEPIAWGGPVVMNTREELAIAFRELREGRFIRSTPSR